MSNLSHSTSIYATLNDWIAREEMGFSIESPQVFGAAVDNLLASLGQAVELLGLGEPLHGSQEILILRNRLFQRLVEAHGYSAIAVESSLPRSRIVSEYVAGRGPTSYDAVQEVGFSHNLGRLEANRELVEWMRRYNAGPAHSIKLQFYGFDSPTEMVGSDSPRQLLTWALDYLAARDGNAVFERRTRIEGFLGNDFDWENPGASFDPTKSIGRSPAATALRIETEDLITELRLRRPELASKSDQSHYLEALHYACAARNLLNYHAALARSTNTHLIELLGIRDLTMADNLAAMLERERSRDGAGKVFAFAHNTHLQRGKAFWQWGSNALEWWPAGAHLHETLGWRYAVIGSGLGVSDDNGIAAPEPGTLESRLTASPGPARFIPTHRSQGLPPSEIAALPTRTGSVTNQTYFPLTPKSLIDFDWLVVLNSTSYNLGGPRLQNPNAIASK